MLLRTLFPTRTIALLMAIGFIDLLSTAMLHRSGLIVEMNPLMRPLIETSEWLFAAVKAATLVAAWMVMVRYTEQNRSFVRQACLGGSAIYVFIWCVWFFSGR